MAKIELTDLAASYRSVEAMNANNVAIEAAIENTLSRDGTAPNDMQANLDMGDNRIINTADAVDDHDVPNLAQTTALIENLVPEIGEIVTPVAHDFLQLDTTTEMVEFLGVDDLVAAEAATRLAGDAGISSNLTAETAARIAADSAEATARAAADTTLTTSLATKSTLKTLLDFGADPTGVADCQTALSAAITYGVVVVGPGTFKFTSNNSISVPVIFAGGAMNLSTGITTTFNRQVIAPKYQIFLGSGNSGVVFDKAFTPVGYPEWWGAIAGVNTSGQRTINVAAINQCILTCAVTELGHGDYYTDATVVIGTNYRTLRGAQKGYGGGGTSIHIFHTTSPALRIGLASNPGSIGSHAAELTVENLNCYRATTLAHPPSAGAGYHTIDVKWVLFAWISRVNAWGSQIGFFVSGTVQAHFYQCYSARIEAADSTTNDYFQGFLLDGNSGIAAAGGNASTYFTECTAGSGMGTSIPSDGWAFSNAGADTFLTRCEVTTCHNGVQYVGSLGHAKEQSGDADISFIGCVFDGLYSNGFNFSSVAPGAMITITDCYVAPSGSSTGFIGFQINGSSGNIIISGCQVPGWPYTASAGVVIANSNNISFRDNMYLDCTAPFTATSCSLIEVIGDTSNNLTKSVSGRGAFQFTTSNRCVVKPRVQGGSNRASYGIELVSTGNSYMNCDPTLVHPTTASGNKLRVNGANITANGTDAQLNNFNGTY